MVKDVFGMIVHPIRLKIISFLKNKPDSTVAEISNGIGEDVTLVAAHLKMLQRHGLVASNAEDMKTPKRYVYVYRLKSEEEVRMLLDRLISKLHEVQREFLV
ncbi:MAG: ArsR family transcriptional regulator [Candidatus Bathycorpusculaceae bacterium]